MKAYAAIAFLAVSAVLAGRSTSLSQRLFRPNEVRGYDSIVARRSLGSVEGFSEEIRSLCVKVQRHNWLAHAGFVGGYEESMTDGEANGAGIVFSIVGRFTSSQRARTFEHRNDSLCKPSKTTKASGATVAQFNINGVPASRGYHLSSGATVNVYWVMFTVGPYLYMEAVTGRRSEGGNLASGVVRLYSRVRKEK